MDQAPNEGRVKQKERTRAAILDSAARLVREGQRPTVEEAALAAGISKRTAYRYFTSQEHMLADAALDSLRRPMAELFAAPAASANVQERISALAVALTRLAKTHEAELREMMRASLQQNSGSPQTGPARPARGRRRLEWIETALQPMRDQLPKDRYIRLVDSLAVCLGIDALLVLRDVCGVTDQAAEEVMVWMANTMVERAIAETQGD